MKTCIPNKLALLLSVLFLLAVPAFAQSIDVTSLNYGNGNVVVESSGVGPPASSCTDLARYTQTDATAGSNLWLCIAGTMVNQVSGSTLTLPANYVGLGNGAGVSGARAPGFDANSAYSYITTVGTVSASNGFFPITDSIGAAVGGQQLHDGYVYIAANDFGLSGPLNNSPRQSGSNQADQAYLVPYYRIPTERNNPVAINEAVTNDAGSYSTASASNLTSFKKNADGVNSWVSTPPSARLFTAPKILVGTLGQYNTAVNGSVSTPQLTLTMSAPLPNYVTTGYTFNLTGTTSTTFSPLAGGTALTVNKVQSNNYTTNNNNQLVFNYTCSSCGTFPTFAITSVATAASGVAVYTGTITGGGSNAYANYTFALTGATVNTVNNGTFLCTGSSATTLSCQNPAAIAETYTGSAVSQQSADTFYLTPTNWTTTGTGWTTNGVVAAIAITAVGAASGGSTVYTGTVTGGAGNAYAGHKFVEAGMTTSANNGTFLCTASTATTLTLSNASGVAEAESGATATSVGDFPLFDYLTTSTANDTIYTTFNIGETGVLLVHYAAYPLGTGTFETFVDGAVKTEDITAVTDVVSNSGLNVALDFPSATGLPAAIYKNISPGNHTIAIKNINGGQIGIADIESPQEAQQGGSTAPNVFVFGVQKEGADTKSASTIAYNAAALSNAAELNSYGFRVIPCNIRNYTNSSETGPNGTYTQSTLLHLHPGVAGMNQFANAVTDCVKAPQIPPAAQWTQTFLSTAGQAAVINSVPTALISNGGPVLLEASPATGVAYIYNISSTNNTVITATGNSAGNLTLAPGCGVIETTTGGTGQWFVVSLSCGSPSWANLPFVRITGTPYTSNCTSAIFQNTASNLAITLSTACGQVTHQTYINSSATPMTLIGASYGNFGVTTSSVAPGDAVSIDAVTWSGAGGWYISGSYVSPKSVVLTSQASITATSFSTTTLVLPTIPLSTKVRGSCSLIWRQASAVATVQFGLGLSNAVTGLWATSDVWTNQTGTNQTQYTAITTTTTTAVTAAVTPGAAATDYKANIDFTISTTSSNYAAVTLYGLTSNAADALLIQPGSSCGWLP